MEWVQFIVNILLDQVKCESCYIIVVEYYYTKIQYTKYNKSKSKSNDSYVLAMIKWYILFVINL